MRTRILLCFSLALCVCLIVPAAPAQAVACPSGQKDCAGTCISSAAACCPPDQMDCNGACIPKRNICILEPFPGMPTNFDPPTAANPLSAFLGYINGGVWQFVFACGVGFTVATGLIGGLEIVLSNGDSGKIDRGKTKIIQAILGLVCLLLAGVILEFLNPIGFKAS